MEGLTQAIGQSLVVVLTSWSSLVGISDSYDITIVATSDHLPSTVVGPVNTILSESTFWSIDGYSEGKSTNIK